MGHLARGQTLTYQLRESVDNEKSKHLKREKLWGTVTPFEYHFQKLTEAQKQTTFLHRSYLPSGSSVAADGKHGNGFKREKKSPIFFSSSRWVGGEGGGGGGSLMHLVA